MEEMFNQLLPKCLVDCLSAEKERSTSKYVISNNKGEPLSASQFQRIWRYITIRSTRERTIYRYVNGQAIKKQFKPKTGEKCSNRPKIVYCIDFDVSPHLLRHTYITNLIHAGVDPKTVQYLAGHENSKITMDIYAKVKYNKPEQWLLWMPLFQTVRLLRLHPSRMNSDDFVSVFPTGG